MFIPLLHDPYPPASLHAWIHHTAVQDANVTAGVTEHVSVPEAHPACIAVYQICTFTPLLSFTHRKYQVAVDTAFHVYAGGGVTVPDGLTKVALPGGAAGNITIDSWRLAGPYPALFDVCTSHLAVPADSAVEGYTDRRPCTSCTAQW